MPRGLACLESHPSHSGSSPEHFTQLDILLCTAHAPPAGRLPDRRSKANAATASISRTHSQCQRGANTPHASARRSARNPVFIPGDNGSSSPPSLFELRRAASADKSRRLASRSREAAQAGGARRDRTDDLKLAKLALSQLSYGPIEKTQKTLRSRARILCFQCSESCRAAEQMVGRVGVEPTTSRLSGVRSNHLSYRPPCQTRGTTRAAGGWMPAQVRWPA